MSCSTTIGRSSRTLMALVSAANGEQAPELGLPAEPIEPYLLTKESGPFMVLARVFRGPDAQRWALSLAKELERVRPTCLYLSTEKEPGAQPAGKVRTFNEAAVLVGDEKCVVDQEDLWRRVKRIRPKCLENLPAPLRWRAGLSTALRTTNPLVPDRMLFPPANDNVLMRTNSGLQSFANCPGRFSLQVAEFFVRSNVGVRSPDDSKPVLPNLDESIRKAHAEAEEMAGTLAASPEIRRMGIRCMFCSSVRRARCYRLVRFRQ